MNELLAIFAGLIAGLIADRIFLSIFPPYPPVPDTSRYRHASEEEVKRVRDQWRKVAKRAVELAQTNGISWIALAHIAAMECHRANVELLERKIQ